MLLRGLLYRLGTVRRLLLGWIMLVALRWRRRWPWIRLLLWIRWLLGWVTVISVLLGRRPNILLEMMMLV